METKEKSARRGEFEKQETDSLLLLSRLIQKQDGFDYVRLSLIFNEIKLGGPVTDCRKGSVNKKLTIKKRG